MGSKKVCIVGSGNWGSAIAKIVGGNAARLQRFEPAVRLWVFDEDVGGARLSDIINTRHENVKYLPGHRLPDNVVAVPDLVQAAAGADVLIFVVPHQFVGGICEQLREHVRKDAIGVSLIKVGCGGDQERGLEVDARAGHRVPIHRDCPGAAAARLERGPGRARAGWSLKEYDMLNPISAAVQPGLNLTSGLCPVVLNPYVQPPG